MSNVVFSNLWRTPAERLGLLYVCRGRFPLSKHPTNQIVLLHTITGATLDTTAQRGRNTPTSMTVLPARTRIRRISPPPHNAGQSPPWSFLLHASVGSCFCALCGWKNTHKLRMKAKPTQCSILDTKRIVQLSSYFVGNYVLGVSRKSPLSSYWPLFDSQEIKPPHPCPQMPCLQRVAFY